MRSDGKFVLGVLVGAAAALMLSPRSGADNRAHLRRLLEQGRQCCAGAESAESAESSGLGDLIDEVREKSAHFMASGGEYVSGKKQDLLEAIQVAKRTLAEDREALEQRRLARRSAMHGEAGE